MLPSERRWKKQGVHYYKKQEFRIVEELSKEYNIQSLCICMSISKSGYYKWIKTKDLKNQYEIDREILKELIEDIHKEKPSYGYRRIASRIKTTTG